MSPLKFLILLIRGVIMCSHVIIKGKGVVVTFLKPNFLKELRILKTPSRIKCAPS
jgi:hypothetical protein